MTPLLSSVITHLVRSVAEDTIAPAGALLSSGSWGSALRMPSWNE